MNLYFRLLWTALRTWLVKPIGLNDTLEREFRVWPNDIDINRHMNNGRYLTMIDLMLIEYFSRVGFLKVILKKGWRPMSGGSMITYRHGLKPFQKYRIRFTWVGSDEKWNYIRFEFLTLEGRLCAAGYFKGAVVSRDGFVPNAVSFAEMDIPLETGNLPEPVTHWIASEQSMMGELKTIPGQAELDAA